MKSHWLLILLIFAIGLSMGTVSGDKDLGFVRAIYGPWNYSHDAKVGLDADYDNSWWTFGGDRVLGKFRTNSLDAAANNITYICGLYYLGDEAKFDYVRAVNMFGQEQVHTPSTVDRTYWLRLMEEPAMAIANLSLYHPIWGLAWDFELYLANEGWDPHDYSFDGPALEAFANESGRSIPPLSPAMRYDWLKDNGLLDDFLGWQEEVVYRMAKGTEEKAHAINPNLSLGILGFSDSWRYWITLEAFSTPQAPVTIWTEDTYGGYNERRIEELQGIFDGRGLNGKILPGLYTVVLSPWTMIENMEMATRHNGAFWIYQHNGDQYRLADEWTYSRAYEIFDRYIFFNRSRPEILPSFDLYPGIMARPYKGPEGVSLLLKPRFGISYPDDVILLTESKELHYVGRNLNILRLESPNLSYKDLPCIVYGLSENDLLPTRTWSMIQELEVLLSSYNPLGLERIDAVEALFEASVADFQAGKYGSVESRLVENMDDAYDHIFERVWPLVEEAMKSPRTSKIPLSTLTKISGARRMYQKGQRVDGNAYLIGGLRDWSEAVDESCVVLFLASVAILVRARRT